MQENQEIAADSLANTTDTTAAADSLATITDTTVTVAADTTGAIQHLNEEISEASDLLVAGELGLFFRSVLDSIVTLIPEFLGPLVTLLVFYGLYRLLYAVIRRTLQRRSYVGAGLQTLTLQAFRLLSLTLIGILTLGQLGFDITTLIAGLGIAGIAVGIAARDSLENVISGVTILVDQPFRIGDQVIIQNTYGTVREITLRSTRIRTPNNEVLVLPNVQMINQLLFNHAQIQPLRVEIPFNIAYKEYPQKAREAVLTLTEGDDRLDTEHLADVAVTALNDSSIDLMLRIHISDPSLEIPIRNEYTEKIREVLRQKNIEIPFPHVQLMVDKPDPAP